MTPSAKNKKRLAVSLASNRDDKKNKISRENEISFFNSINDNFYYETKDGHEMASKSNLIISLDSTLSIELLYKGYKMCIINPTGFLGKAHIFEDKPLNGFFWVNENCKDKIFKTIDNLLSMSNKAFEENLKKENITKYYEEKNSSLKKLIDKKLISLN